MAVLLWTLSVAGEIRADWEFTRWGMRLKEVRDASPVKIVPARHGERVLKRISRESVILAYTEAYDWHEHSFEVRFGFDAYARLNGIFLLTDGSSFASLEAALVEMYGQPLSRAEMPLPCRLWVDKVGGDYIRLRRFSAAVVEQVPTAGRTRSLRCLGLGHPAEPEDKPPVAPPLDRGVDSS